MDHYAQVLKFFTGNAKSACSVQFELEDILMEKPASPTSHNSMSCNFSCRTHQALPEPLREIPREVNNFGIMESENSKDEVSALNNQMALKQQAHMPSFMSLGTCGFAKKRLNIQNGNNLSNQESRSIERRHKFSAQAIVKMAASRYIGLHAQGHGDVSMPMQMQPLKSVFTGLSEGDIVDVQLVLLLLAAAEKVSNEQFDNAKQFLFYCQYWLASKDTNCIRKVVQIFAQALQERIQREIIGIPIMGSTRNDEHESIQSMNSNFKLMCHDKVPFNQIMQFAAIQSIVEHLSSETRIHVIDLDPGVGVRWAVFIQALAEREEPVQMLKITALGLVGKINFEEAKERLTAVASLLNIPFSYDAVFVRDMSEIKEEVFEVEEGEAVAVYCPLLLRTLVSRPSTLENLMRVLANLKPRVMLLLEVEANHNSPSFITRFTEALFHYSVGFDVFETCFEQRDEGWQEIVPIMGAGIRSIVAMEGSERTVRNVTIDVWRPFLSRFGMKEVGLSESSYCQANLVRKRLPHGNHCTVYRNGKALMIGWKGSPFHSVSAWTCP